MPRLPLDRTPLRPQRLRRITDQSFGFLPHRFLRDGFLRALSADELRLYLAFVLAADPNGVSFYSHDRLRDTLALSLHAYHRAREGLVAKDLVAADRLRVQVLSLPRAPGVNESPLTADQQRAAVRALVASLERAGPK